MDEELIKNTINYFNDAVKETFDGLMNAGYSRDEAWAFINEFVLPYEKINENYIEYLKRNKPSC
jgi:hypothetical protein